MYIQNDLEIMSHNNLKMFQNGENVPTCSDKYSCKCCNYNTSIRSRYTNHLMTASHLKKGCVPTIPTNLYYCNICDYTTHTKYHAGRHNITASHIKRAKLQNSSAGFCCSVCDYTTSRQSQYTRHTLSAKHIKKCNCSDIVLNKVILENSFEPTPNIIPELFNPNSKLIMELLQQNKEFKDMIIDQNKQLQEQNNKIMELAKEPKTVNNITNSNNKTNTQFNLNNFLNEDCKNAMNIGQFIDSIQLTVNDLEETGRLGFIDGLSRIFINALKGLELTDRPIHCTDMKRETVYIKDEDKWAKENNDKTKFVNVLRKIEKKNIGMLPTWINDNPTCRIMDSPEAILYYKIYKSALGDPSKEGIEKQDDKIIKNVLKEVVLEKQTK